MSGNLCLILTYSIIYLIHLFFYQFEPRKCTEIYKNTFYFETFTGDKKLTSLNSFSKEDQFDQ